MTQPRRVKLSANQRTGMWEPVSEEPVSQANYIRQEV